MIRRLFATASVFSLLFCLAAIWLDRRSARLHDVVEWDRAGNRQSIGAISAWRQLQIKGYRKRDSYRKRDKYIYQAGDRIRQLRKTDWP
ncbi:MAG TPA: hypothetical protein VGI81_02795 [Tepidisphaeraceae bacterium]|jgi:hypothetical protein